MKKNNIRIVPKKTCVGCLNCLETCPTNAIYSQKNSFGFVYPKIKHKKCINCGKCISKCPSIFNFKANDFTNVAYGGYSTNQVLRSNSSSGGFFGELATAVLSSGGVVYGAAYDSKFHVHHIRIDDITGLNSLLGSKYIQSDLSNVFKSVKSDLKIGKQVFFVGLPCQIAALKLFLNEINLDNLVCADLICHGVGSPKIFREYLYYIRHKNKNKNIVFFSSRNKTNGWSNYSFSESVTFSDGSSIVTPNKKSLFFRLFGLNVILRKNCFNCFFKGFNRQSDLTLGDFWGCWEIDKDIDDNKGTSLIIVNSDKGGRLLNKINDKIIVKNYDVSIATKYNPAFSESVDGRLTFKRALVKSFLIITSLFFKE